MSELGGIGDAVTGMMVGRTVEPKAGEISGDGHTAESNCLNCGTALRGNFCVQCGQHAHVHRTLGAFFHDLLHGVLHFEGKTWRTLPMLAWRPGELTRRYIDGERAKFVSPMALFLFTIFIMFAVASFTGGFGSSVEANIGDQLRTDIAKGDADLAALRDKRAAAVKAGQPTAELDRRIASEEEDLAGLKNLSVGKIPQGVQLDPDVPHVIAAPFAKLAKNPELALYKFKTSAYKFSWALIPISVPFLWLLFPFSRRFRLYDHTVFVTYSLAFMTLLVILGLILVSVGLGAAAALLLLVPPFHMYRQLKGTYQLGWFSALIRTCLLLTFATIALSLFLTAIFGVGIVE
nr:DUF3667 domain-containing protein [uncultured Sphingomonas sp.]